MPATHLIHRSSIDTGTYEPFDGFEAILAGDPAARVAWLRNTTGGDGVLYAGMFTAQPSTFVYHFAGDETFHVLDGDLDVALGGGEQVSLRPRGHRLVPQGRQVYLDAPGPLPQVLRHLGLAADDQRSHPVPLEAGLPDRGVPLALAGREDHK